jgi:hypothetical protein
MLSLTGCCATPQNAQPGNSLELLSILILLPQPSRLTDYAFAAPEKFVNIATFLYLLFLVRIPFVRFDSIKRAGWHTSLHLRVPEHVHLLFLPAYSPELQPAEHLWMLTNEALVNACFANLEDLEEAQLARCAVLQRQLNVIRSATLFSWWPRRLKRRQGPRRNQRWHLC